MGKTVIRSDSGKASWVKDEGQIQRKHVLSDWGNDGAGELRMKLAADSIVKGWL